MLTSLPKNITSHTGLRGIAAFVVLMAHLQLDLFFPSAFTKHLYYFFNWSHEAVDLFFMLSGFILAHLYASKESIPWRNYFVARFARIYPLALATLLFLLALDLYSTLRHHLPSPNLDSGKILLNLFLLNGIYDGFHVSINGPSWSLSVEAFLYVAIFPALAWLTCRFRKLNSLSWWLIGMTCVVILMGCKKLPWSSFQPIPEEWACLARGILGFTAGYTIRKTFDCENFFKSNLLPIFELTATIGIFITLAMELPSNFLAPQFFILILCTATNKTVLSQTLSHPILSYLGERSYSIYMIHLPLKEFLCRLILWPSQNPIGVFPSSAKIITLSLAFIGAFILAELSYRFFETPLRQKLRARFGEK